MKPQSSPGHKSRGIIFTHERATVRAQTPITFPFRRRAGQQPPSLYICKTKHISFPFTYGMSHKEKASCSTHVRSTSTGSHPITAGAGGTEARRGPMYLLTVKRLIKNVSLIHKTSCVYSE